MMDRRRERQRRVMRDRLNPTGGAEGGPVDAGEEMPPPRVIRPGFWTRPRSFYGLGLLVIAAVAVTAILVATASGGAGAKSIYLVKVGDAVLGCITEKDITEEVLHGILEEEATRIGCEVFARTDIEHEKTKPSGETQTLTPEELCDTLRDNIVLAAKGFVINVNGADVVALSSEEDARGVISDLRAEYIRTVIGTTASVDEVLIKEQVDFQEKEVATTLFRTREEAARVLSRGTDKTLNYVVKRGDSLWAIAETNHLTVDDLKKANPEVQSDLIQIGQNLNLVVPDPYVTLTSKETVVTTVSIPFSIEVTNDPNMWPWQETVTQAGKSGQKRITQVVRRDEGKEVSRVTVSEEILSHPVTKKLTRGSKQVPTMGSGQLVWPVQGTITSYFGYRWGSFHQGVDIGAPSGTEILAADSGMVSLACWNGGYGNCVKIDHGGGLVTLYGHLSKIGVEVGDSVTKGAVIGYVGSTGVSTGPHLHFEIHVDGKAKDPLSFYE